MINNDPMLDKDFLEKLMAQHHREVFVRITLLSEKEMPLQTIEGKAINGSINIDGNSTVRRTCSLTLLAKDIEINEFYWGLNNKFKLETGLKNSISQKYPKIIWFKQGIYVINSFNCTKSTNSYTISIGGKDKMCLLNGEVSGIFPYTIDFGRIEETDEAGDIELFDIPIIEIIKELLQNYANESLDNIVINDVEDYGLELLEYRGTTPIYMLKNINSNIISNMTVNADQRCYVKQGSSWVQKTLGTLNNYDELSSLELEAGYIPDQIKLINSSTYIYTVIKLDYGSFSGYRTTDLTYPGELIGNTGEAITSILDKIKSMLGNFEYFYDINGRFIFQKRQDYIKMPVEFTEFDKEKKIEANINENKSYFNFSDGQLVTSYQNTPNLANIKNDYSIWGQRKTLAGNDIPIHYRYAIDKKPFMYITQRFEDINYLYLSKDYKDVYNIFDTINGLYLKNLNKGQLNDLKSALKSIGNIGVDSYFYQLLNNIKIIVTDWREIIYQMAKDYRKCYHNDDYIMKLIKLNPQYDFGKTGYEYYYTELEGYWRELYNPFMLPEDQARNKYEIYNPEDYNEDTYWNKIIYVKPEQLNFWFDFLSIDLDQYSCQTIGHRPYSKNDSDVKAIYYKEVPQVLFKMPSDGKYIAQTGYTYIQISQQMENMFTISNRAKSGYEAINNLLYNYSYCNEKINLNVLPVYHLEPNHIISVYDNDNNISGEYLVEKITIPLTYNGMMSISATKVLNNIEFYSFGGEN